MGDNTDYIFPKKVIQGSQSLPEVLAVLIGPTLSLNTYCDGTNGPLNTFPQTSLWEDRESNNK